MPLLEPGWCGISENWSVLLGGRMLVTLPWQHLLEVALVPFCHVASTQRAQLLQMSPLLK